MRLGSGVLTPTGSLSSLSELVFLESIALIPISCHVALCSQINFPTFLCSPPHSKNLISQVPLVIGWVQPMKSTGRKLESGKKRGIRVFLLFCVSQAATAPQVAFQNLAVSPPFNPSILLWSQLPLGRPFTVTTSAGPL